GDIQSTLASLFYFFFFQAEDGIRDFHVTGVQTCALPISVRFARRHATAWPAWRAPPARTGALSRNRGNRRPIPFRRWWRAGRERSEERRVGRERSTRWLTGEALVQQITTGGCGTSKKGAR